MGEETIILTFGYPGGSSRFHAVESYLGTDAKDLSSLTPFKVTVGIERDSFFLPETYPDPEVQFLTEDQRYATWIIEFSRPLSNYYRSIHCTAMSIEDVRIRDTLLVLSVLIITLGASLFVNSVVRRLDP